MEFSPFLPLHFTKYFTPESTKAPTAEEKPVTQHYLKTDTETTLNRPLHKRGIKQSDTPLPTNGGNFSTADDKAVQQLIESESQKRQKEIENSDKHLNKALKSLNDIKRTLLESITDKKNEIKKNNNLKENPQTENTQISTNHINCSLIIADLSLQLYLQEIEQSTDNIRQPIESLIEDIESNPFLTESSKKAIISSQEKILNKLNNIKSNRIKEAQKTTAELKDRATNKIRHIHNIEEKNNQQLHKTSDHKKNTEKINTADSTNTDSTSTDSSLPADHLSTFQHRLFQEDHELIETTIKEIEFFKEEIAKKIENMNSATENEFKTLFENLGTTQTQFNLPTKISYARNRLAISLLDKTNELIKQIQHLTYSHQEKQINHLITTYKDSQSEETIGNAIAQAEKLKQDQDERMRELITEIDDYTDNSWLSMSLYIKGLEQTVAKIFSSADEIKKHREQDGRIISSGNTLTKVQGLDAESIKMIKAQNPASTLSFADNIPEALPAIINQQWLDSIQPATCPSALMATTANPMTTFISKTIHTTPKPDTQPPPIDIPDICPITQELTELENEAVCNIDERNKKMIDEINALISEFETDVISNDQQKYVTAQNLVGNFTETPLQPNKTNKDFPENAFLPPNFEQLQKYHKALKSSVVKCHNDVTDMIKEYKKLIDDNPTDYPDPDRIKQRLDELCALENSALADQVIPEIYKRTGYHIPHSPNQCESTGAEQTGEESEPTDVSGNPAEINAPGTDSKDKKIARHIRSSSNRAIASLSAEAQQPPETGPVTSGASRPGNFVSDIVIGTAALLTRTFSPGQLANNAYQWIAGTGTESQSTPQPPQKQPATTDKNPGRKTYSQAPNTPVVSPAMVRMNGTSQLVNTPMITNGRASQSPVINGHYGNSADAIPLIVAKFRGGKIHQKDKIQFSPPSAKSAIHNNPASILLATSLTDMTKVLLSKTFQDMISPTAEPFTDASLTQEDILHIAILKEYCSHNEPPRTIPFHFLEDVQNSPVVGFNSGSDNFEINDNGEYTLKKGKTETEYRSLLLRSLARDCRKSLLATRTDNTRENSSMGNGGDDALATQIHGVLPDTSFNKRAIIHRAIMLQDQQKTSLAASIVGLFGPNREVQIKSMHSLLNSVSPSRRRQPVPEAQSGGIPVESAIINKLRENEIEEAQALFFNSSPAQMLEAIDKLRGIMDVAVFDKSERVYNKVKQGFTELASGNKSSGQISQKSNTSRNSALYIAKQGASIQDMAKKEILTKVAWDLLLYQYDIKINMLDEIHKPLKLQARILREKKVDTIDEAEVLSQIIPEILGSKDSTLYEKSRVSEHLKLSPPYQRLQYSGSKFDAKLQQYNEIKERTRSLYAKHFAPDTDSQEKIVRSVALKCLIQLNRKGRKGASDQASSEFILKRLTSEISNGK